MADVPSSLNDVQRAAILNQNISFQGSNDDLYAIVDLRIDNDIPDYRTNYADTYLIGSTQEDIIISFSLVATIDAFDWFVDHTRKQTNGQPLITTWVITWTALNGTKETRSFQGFVRNHSYIKGANQNQASMIEGVIRVTNPPETK